MSHTDVFITTAAVSDQRRIMFSRVAEYWEQERKAKVHIVTPATVGCSLEEFNRQRRIYAESEARGLFYILTDDDCLPLSGDTLSIGLDTIQTHNEFALLSAWPANETIQRWTPPEVSEPCYCCGALDKCPVCQGSGHYTKKYEPVEDLQVTEHVSVGGLRFMRKGVMALWPNGDGQGYDMTQCIYIRERGMRAGYMQHVRMLHMGKDKTELWLKPEESERQRVWGD